MRAPAEPNLIDHRCARNARIKWFCAPVEMASTRYCDRKSNNKCSLEPKCNIIYNAMQWRVGKIGSQFCFYHLNQLEICSFVKYSSRCSCWLWKVCLCLFYTVEWVCFTRQKPYRVERSKWFNTDKVKESQAWHRVKTLVHFHLRAYVLFVCLMIVQLCLSRWLQWCVVCITIAGCRSIVMHESHSMVLFRQERHFRTRMLNIPNVIKRYSLHFGPGHGSDHTIWHPGHIHSIVVCFAECRHIIQQSLHMWNCLLLFSNSRRFPLGMTENLLIRRWLTWIMVNYFV